MYLKEFWAKESYRNYHHDLTHGPHAETEHQVSPCCAQACGKAKNQNRINTATIMLDSS
jgi:hypothetical protein